MAPTQGAIARTSSHSSLPLRSGCCGGPGAVSSTTTTGKTASGPARSVHAGGTSAGPRDLWRCPKGRMPSASTSSSGSARRSVPEPYVAVNVGSGVPQEAANWAEYCNYDGDTELADRRCENGYEEPYGVKYWGLGNENWGRPDESRTVRPGSTASSRPTSEPSRVSCSIATTS